jgi:hypothetical protein
MVMTKKLSTLRALAPILVLAVAALPGCGGGGEETAAPAAVDQAPAPESAPAVDTSQTGSVKGVVTLTNGPDPDT